MDMFGVNHWCDWTELSEKRVLDWTSNHFFVWILVYSCQYAWKTIISNPTLLQHIFSHWPSIKRLLKFLKCPTPSFPLLEGKGAFIGPFRIHSCCGCFCQCWGLREGRGDRRPFFHMIDPPNWWKFWCNLKPRNWYTVYIHVYRWHIYIYTPINYNPKL